MVVVVVPWPLWLPELASMTVVVVSLDYRTCCRQVITDDAVMVSVAGVDAYVDVVDVDREFVGMAFRWQ